MNVLCFGKVQAGSTVHKLILQIRNTPQGIGCGATHGVRHYPGGGGMVPEGRGVVF